MLPRTRNELCVATVVFVFCLGWTARVLLHTTPSESLELLCFAITSLVSSWLISANEKRRRERRAAASAARALASSRLAENSAAAAISVVVRSEQPLMVLRTARASDPLANAAKGSAPVHAFSIDLEDYFHTEVAAQAVSPESWHRMPSRLENTVPRLLDLLDETENRATVFVLGWIAEKYPELVQRIASRGHEIACHSYRHQAVFRLNADSFYEDTRKAKYITEDAVGCVISGYRAPCFSITQEAAWAFDVLGELDFSYDSSVNPIHHGFYGNARAPHLPHYVADSGILEIPIAVWRVGGLNLPVGGGAYLRLLPYAYSLAGLRRVSRVEKRSATLYMHPWEMDAQQPGLRLPLLSHIRQTWGTSTMESRLRGVLTEFRFAPLAEVYSGMLTGGATTAAPAVHDAALAAEAFLHVAAQ